MVTTTLTVATPSTCGNVSGRYLAHNHCNLVVRAFQAADLFSGVKKLVLPITMLQAADLARVNPTYAWTAYRRLGERDAIEQGYIPLVPPRVASKKNGSAFATAGDITDAQLLELIRLLGTGRVLEAACAVEASQ
jgi:hypothetical protein